jgi:hypothetical protein
MRPQSPSTESFAILALVIPLIVGGSVGALLVFGVSIHSPDQSAPLSATACLSVTPPLSQVGNQTVCGVSYAYETVSMPPANSSGSSPENVLFNGTVFHHSWGSIGSPGGVRLDVVVSSPPRLAGSISLIAGPQSPSWTTVLSPNGGFGAQWGPAPGLRVLVS